MMKNIIKIIAIILLILILLVGGLLLFISTIPSVPTHYTRTIKTGGLIEAKYLQFGPNHVTYQKEKGTELTKYFHIYYPQELEKTQKQYPVVVILNGTGILPKKYPALFQHLASWGFIVIGNDDPSTGFGLSADETIDYLIKINDDQNHILYHHINFKHIGITGHSQGGAGVLTAVSHTKHQNIYKTAVALSPTHEKMAHDFGWSYDLTQISIPLFMIAGTKGDFETKAVIPLEAMIEMYNKVPSSKVMMRRKDTDHGGMLYSTDGYVTAWLMWQLQDDIYASHAFLDDNAEIYHNNLYQDVQMNK